MIERKAKGYAIYAAGVIFLLAIIFNRYQETEDHILYGVGIGVVITQIIYSLYDLIKSKPS